MRHFSPDHDIPPDAMGASIALGNFDGVHLGHQAVLRAAREAAALHGLVPAAAVFEPHPRRLFQPDAPPFRLQSSRQRARALAEAGAQLVFDIRFDRDLAQLSDEQFSAQILAARLSARQICVGFDFRYGRARIGDVESLRAQGAVYGFDVAIIDKLTAANGEKISSTAIRDAISVGRMDQAAHLLARPWAIEGEVVHGFARGRQINLPTANIRLGDYIRPKTGIYAVRVNLGDGLPRPGAASFGTNPTIGALSEPVLETHILDFTGDLYGQIIEVEMIAYLRDEQKFSTLEAMRQQIDQDIAQSRAILTA